VYRSALVGDVGRLGDCLDLVSGAHQVGLRPGSSTLSASCTRGPRRVAQGDFNYRVELNTRDEMAELADAFNKMTCRFRKSPATSTGKCRSAAGSWLRSERLAGVGFPGVRSRPTRSTTRSRRSPWVRNRWRAAFWRTWTSWTLPTPKSCCSICG